MPAKPLQAQSMRSSTVRPLPIAELVAQIWLALGILAVICIPALRGRSEWFGALPLWLIAVPLANLLILRWRAVLGASQSTFARLRPRPAAASHYAIRASRKSRAAHRRSAPGQLGSLVAGIFR